MSAAPLSGCAAGRSSVEAGQAAGSPGAPYRALVIECVPATLPAAFLSERGKTGEDGALLFSQTRDTVLTTLDLYLGTGRWAGDAVPIAKDPPPPRPGTSEECRALSAIAAGAAPATLPSSEEISFGRVAVTGIVSYDYLPIEVHGQTIPPRVEVRLAVALSHDGKVRYADTVRGRTDYARVSMGYEERNSQEVAQALTERLAEGLRALVKKLPR